MRITESRLRKLIRKMIQEAPLAGFDEPVMMPPRNRDAYGLSGLTAKKIFTSQNFAKNLKRIMSSFPIDIWVSPAIKYSDLKGKAIGEHGRIWIADPDDIWEHESRYSENDIEIQIINAWWEKTNGRGALFIPCALNSEPGNELTPWMMLHAMFDSEINSSIKPPARGFYGVLRIRLLVERALTAMVECAEIVDKTENTHNMIERIFTFGSARKRYYTRNIAGMNDINRGRALYNDMRNEAAVQSILSTGFKYDKEAFDNFRNTVRELATPEIQPKIEDLLQSAEDNLQLSEQESPGAREGFIRAINGKVIIVNI